MEINIKIGSDNICHATIKCENNETFQRVEKCMDLAKKEIEFQIQNKKSCPMHPK